MYYHNLCLSLLTLSFLLLATPNAYSGQYSLFNPVPQEKMKSMTTERPSKADSSYTIDAGHFQVETSLYSLQKNKDADGRSRSESVFSTTHLRLGISELSEIQMIVNPIIWQKTIDYAHVSTQHTAGFGDVTLRYKYNVMGNGATESSLAVIPFVKLPTNSNGLSNNAVEGGVSVPFDWNLKHGFSFNYTIQAMVLKRADKDSMSEVFANMFVLSKQLNDKFSGYVEYFAQQIPGDNNHVQQTMDFGIVYQVNKNFSLDSALNFGLSNRSNDVELLVGGAYRF